MSLPITTSHIKFARLVSDLLNPLFVAIPTLLAVALYTAPTIWRGIAWWFVTTIAISVTPMIFIVRGVQQGKYIDLHLTKREERFIPQLIGIASAMAGFAFLWLINASHVLLATIGTIMIGGIITLIITIRWKISMHMVGISGSVTVLTLLFGPWMLILSPLVALVGWARIQVKAHTSAQTIAGTILAIGITALFFAILGIV
jgi:membrane-associated phospholipid phosphatase